MSKRNVSSLSSALSALLDISDDAFAKASLGERKYQLFCCKAALVLTYLHTSNERHSDFSEYVELAAKLNLMCDDALSLAKEHHDFLCQLIIDWQDRMGGVSDITSFYQGLLACDLLVRDDCYYVGSSKTQRDATGSYYTPTELASSLAKYTFEALEIPDGCPPRCVDFSCGAGDFLVAAYRELTASGFSAEDAIRALWGYDVDPIALTITVYRLLAVSGVGASSVGEALVTGHFHFGNPLLAPCGHDSKKSRYKVYAKGLLYSPDMSIDEDCFPKDGFQVVLGNPPWEKIRFEERKFLKLYSPSIGSVSNKAKRLTLINELRSVDQHEVIGLYDELTTSYAQAKTLIDPRYLANARGEINTYVAFTLLALQRLAPEGHASLVLKSALFTSPNNGTLFSSLLNGGNLSKIWLFSNEKKVFDIDQRERFAVAVFTSCGKRNQVDVSFGNTDNNFLTAPMLRVSTDELAALNPTTTSLPDVDSIYLFKFILDVQKKHPTFSDVYPGAHFGRLVHLTTHAKWISRTDKPDFLPVFEGKFIGQHDLRYSTFDGVPESLAYAGKASARVMNEVEKATNPAQSRFFINKQFWSKISRNYSEGLMLCWRSLTSSTNRRTTIAALCPFVPACQSVQFLQLDSVENLVILAGLFNSKAFDFLVKQKIPGIDLTQKVIGQIPVPRIEAYETKARLLSCRGTYREEIVKRVLALYKNEPDLLRLISSSIDVTDAAFGSRDEVVNELDALFYSVYGFSEDEISLIESRFG